MCHQHFNSEGVWQESELWNIQRVLFVPDPTEQGRAEEWIRACSLLHICVPAAELWDAARWPIKIIKYDKVV